MLLLMQLRDDQGSSLRDDRTRRGPRYYRARTAMRLSGSRLAHGLGDAAACTAVMCWPLGEVVVGVMPVAAPMGGAMADSSILLSTPARPGRHPAARPDRAASSGNDPPVPSGNAGFVGGSSYASCGSSTDS
uniref:hypothetical protein n=1 Tax=Micromonospora sp. NBC_00855 TaxID=2975978 RepID=UPI0037C7C94E